MSLRTEQIADGITLHLGDCLDILPTLGSVAHIFSDPPYEDELHEGAKERRIVRSDGRAMYGDLGFVGINGTRDAVAAACVAASDGWCLLFTLAEGVRAWRDALQAAKAKYDTTLFWVKPDASPRFNGQGAARGAECMVTAWCGRGHRSWNGGGRRGVFTHLVNADRQGEHPTEKPVPLMVELVSLYSQPDQLICDPFMGSGTTGVAAVKTGRCFVGIEQDTRWFDLSCRRIEAALKAPGRFKRQQLCPDQSFLFGESA
ncbi:site-specific DNA-methyltransferase [Methylobacterium sp. C25]|uniref:DNA-methyltransferase n=1 Tax=Methylobacterium sp. C25 TaxID=2721622 RepID=UPI001F3E54AB|nr:DNA methyltransferase [Methylobacterium sp. C25]MCE4223426.1 site-specific DNA-methyltransferase [Methylobacterium sp. C25]